jgi:hypothetical protein
MIIGYDIPELAATISRKSKFKIKTLKYLEQLKDSNFAD